MSSTALSATQTSRAQRYAGSFARLALRRAHPSKADVALPLTSVEQAKIVTSICICPTTLPKP
jgi:hypothetical protein